MRFLQTRAGLIGDHGRAVNGQGWENQGSRIQGSQNKVGEQPERAERF
jgi:hypothetical protein